MESSVPRTRERLDEQLSILLHPQEALSSYLSVKRRPNPIQTLLLPNFGPLLHAVPTVQLVTPVNPRQCEGSREVGERERGRECPNFRALHYFIPQLPHPTSPLSRCEESAGWTCFFFL